MQVFGKMCTHGLDVGTHLRAFGHDGCVDVADLPLLLTKQIISVIEKNGARLIFPARLAKRLSPAKLDTLLLHELAHFARRDHWLRALEMAACVVYWWNPLVWWTRREIERAEEECCDAWVIDTLPEERRSYAEALIEVTEHVSQMAAPVPAGTNAAFDNVCPPAKFSVAVFGCALPVGKAMMKLSVGPGAEPNTATLTEYAFTLAGMTLQLVAVRSANDRVELSAIIPPPRAPALLSRVSTARHGSMAMKLAFEETAAFGPTRNGIADGTVQFFSGSSSSLTGAGRAPKMETARKQATALVTMRCMAGSP